MHPCAAWSMKVKLCGAGGDSVRLSTGTCVMISRVLTAGGQLPDDLSYAGLIGVSSRPGNVEALPHRE
jgi:hypothetical protein